MLCWVCQTSLNTCESSLSNLKRHDIDDLKTTLQYNYLCWFGQVQRSTSFNNQLHYQWTWSGQDEENLKRLYQVEHFKIQQVRHQPKKSTSLEKEFDGKDCNRSKVNDKKKEDKMIFSSSEVIKSTYFAANLTICLLIFSFTARIPCTVNIL